MATLSNLLGQNFPNGTFANDVTFESSGFVRLPNGTTAQRPVTASSGMFRFNTETNEFEGYNGTVWGAIGGGGADEYARTLAYLGL